MNAAADISGIATSMSEVMGKLNSFLADSVILDLGLGIAALGRDVVSLMGASLKELNGVQFSDVCVDSDFSERLESSLRPGYFVDLQTHLWTRGGELCKVSLSGFYLGLISDINGYIIVKVKPEGDSSTLKNELFMKRRELDKFIYRAAHELRGPLATIKGLVNLLKVRKTDVEVDKLTGLIEVHADQLDDRLFKLLYSASDNGHYEGGNGCINFRLLKDCLIKTLKDNSQLDKTILRFDAPETELCQVNDLAIARMARHVFLYITGLPQAAAQTDEIEIRASFQVAGGNLNITIDAKGFVTSEPIRKAIQKPTSLYNDLSANPFLLNYYVAYKEAVSLGAAFHVNFFGNRHQVVNLVVPVSQPNYYQHIN